MKQVDILGTPPRIFYFKIERAPSEIPANLLGQFSLSEPFFLHWAAVNLKGLVQF